jgi:hypothetical protein
MHLYKDKSAETVSLGTFLGLYASELLSIGAVDEHLQTQPL